MSELQELINFAKMQLKPILKRKGAVLYSSNDTLTKGKYYIVGQNPAGSENSGETIEKTLDELLTYRGNAYVDEDWKSENGDYKKGEHPIQRGLYLLMRHLGYNISEICASNLFFYRAPDKTYLKYPEDADMCWSVHERIINIVKPKIIITFGNGDKTLFEYLKTKYKYQSEISIPTYNSKFSIKFYEINDNNIKYLVVGLPHLSYYHFETDYDILDKIKIEIDKYSNNNIEKIEIIYYCRNRLKRIKYSTDNIYEKNLDKVKSISDENKYLKSFGKSTDYLLNVINNISNDKINSIETGYFDKFTLPLENFCITGSIMNYVESEKDIQLTGSSKQETIINNLDGTAGNYVYEIHNILNTQKDLVSNEDEIFEKYKVNDKLKENIKYIEINIGTIDKTYEKDFDTFLQKYFAFEEDAQKYQDFIAARTMFFLKIVFTYSEKSGIIGRRNQIKYFALGKTPEDSYTRYIIDDAHDLWKDLSSQDSTGQSAKLGNIEVAEVSNTFRRFISVFKNLLEIRNKYYKD